MLLTLPYYSDLQLIELLWARIKGCIARSHSKTTTLQQVREKLDKEFLQLGTDGGRNATRSIVLYVYKTIQKFEYESNISENLAVSGEETETESDCSSIETITENSSFSVFQEIDSTYYLYGFNSNM